MMEAVLRRDILVSRNLCRGLAVAACAVCTCLGAFVRIPLAGSPVPLTLQTFFVLLGGACLGGRAGTLAQVSYVLLGMLGLPVFTGAGSGLAYLAGSTGGYIAGFLAAQVIIGSFIGRARGFGRTFLLLCCADAVILACGTVWLKVACGLSISAALAAGFLVFIPGDLVKVYAASRIFGAMRRRCAEIL